MKKMPKTLLCKYRVETGFISEDVEAESHLKAVLKALNGKDGTEIGKIVSCKMERGSTLYFSSEKIYEDHFKPLSGAR